MKKIATAFALFGLLGTALAAAPAPAPRPVDISAIIPVCEAGLEAAIAGHDAGPVLEQGFKALPPEQRAAAEAVCQVYALGAVSMLKHMSAAPKIPAGGTSISFDKCGPDGTVDWDDNPAFPPPHCNRNGWNGRIYRSE
jgi:hypothetical protein